MDLSGVSIFSVQYASNRWLSLSKTFFFCVITALRRFSTPRGAHSRLSAAKSNIGAPHAHSGDDRKKLLHSDKQRFAYFSTLCIATLSFSRTNSKRFSLSHFPSRFASFIAITKSIFPTRGSKYAGEFFFPWTTRNIFVNIYGLAGFVDNLRTAPSVFFIHTSNN